VSVTQLVTQAVKPAVKRSSQLLTP